MTTQPPVDAQEMALLRTKLYIPPLRREQVPRPRLLERLNAGLDRKLTLISAPAGFGKTTLVSEWVQITSNIAATGGADPPIAVAWLSLDESDNDPARFLTYVIAALRTVKPDIGKGALSALQSPQPPPTETILTSLINEIAAIPDRIILVLDDYHIIQSSPLDQALTFLLEHLPPQMHLVIATREDPQLPLARLRVRGQLTEVRVADLRFTLSKAAEFLNQVMGLNLSVEEIAALETRTEGWIASLQLAALALQGITLQSTLSTQGPADSASFIRAFSGSHHFVLDYLVEEILQHQSERVRSFLLQTSILDRLSAPLCDAVRFGLAESPTGQKDGKGMLETLARSNLFVVPLDDQRRWYRYHHLFADVLHAHLTEEQPDLVLILHQRASEWYERNGLPADAVRHALAAGDFERVASIAELAWQAMDNNFQSATWFAWVKKLPDELIRTRPVLSTQCAWALWLDGELEASEARLRDAERWLDPTRDVSAQPEGLAGGTCPACPEPSRWEQSRRMVVVDKEQFRTLPVSIANARANNAQAQGDVSGTVKYAELALELTPEKDLLGRGQAISTLGLAYWASGDLEAAHIALADWINSAQKAGNIIFAIASTFALADIMVAQGHLNEAVRAYEGALQLVPAHDEHVQRVIAHLYLGLAMLYHEMGDREAAAHHLLKAKELGEQSTLPDWPYRWCLAQAQLKEAGGDLQAALDLLDEAKRVYVRTVLPDIRPIEALKARVYVRQGRLPKALAWVQERGLSVDDEISYLCEFEYLTLSRVLIAKASSPIAQYKSDRVDGPIHEAVGLLARLLKAAEASGRTGSIIEILVMQALAYHAQGDAPRALDSLERALTLAEPEGYVRIFVDEGPSMAELLRQAAKRGIAPNYVSRLWTTFGQAGGTRPVNQLLIEPLSKRELAVLGLLRTELNGPEIARELGVSLATIRTHTQNIYGKLGVNKRWAAVRRAEELDLL